MSASVAQLLTAARQAEQSGNADEARAQYMAALELEPNNASLCNDVAGFLLRNGDAAGAQEFYAKACQLEPGASDFALNHAIALTRSGRPQAALDTVIPHEAKEGAMARYWSIRANAASQAGQKAKAAKCYDRCLAIDPAHKNATHGRARLALDRVEEDAVDRYDRALVVDNGNPELWLGKAQALEAAGDDKAARSIAESLAAQIPQWHEGMRYLAQLRLAAGESDFTAHYFAAAKQRPDDANIPFGHCEALAGLGYAKEAAEVASKARKRFPELEQFALLEAIHTGSAGDDARAETIFQTLSLEGMDRWRHEARHALRMGRPEQADSLLARALSEAPEDIASWALRGIAWRLLGDERHEWLHPPETISRRELLADADLLGEVRSLLHELHNQSSLPLGQSVRGGSQTRGGLFIRADQRLQALGDCVANTVRSFQTELGEADVSHPLLKHRDALWRFAGSWSVRLQGGTGHHVGHIHPQGIVSSALYIDVPEMGVDDGPEAGWLEIGRPPEDLRLDLPPITTIKPEPGYLALFPSTMYHGTRPFGDGLRMTVAFDVVPVQ